MPDDAHQTTAIKTLFASDIYRRIEEVIKVDQDKEQIVRDEISEYIVTDTIRKSYVEILETYYETRNKPREGIGVWVSGFFGSGKSSFAKMLGIALENRHILGEGAAHLIGQRTGDKKSQLLLKQISEQIPTNAVIFDVSTDRGIRSGNQTLTEITYHLFLRSLGYAKDLDLAELEIALEEKGELPRFVDAYRREYNQEWDDNKEVTSFSLVEASKVMHLLYPGRFEGADSWVKAVHGRADITAGKLAKRCVELMSKRGQGRNLVFVIDEVGQFVARDIQKMLDLQAVVQNLGRAGMGKIWLVVTSQERLTELVGGLEDKRVELARLMDRFPIQVHLEPSDISEVTSKRVLAKNAGAEKSLRALYDAHSGRLAANTRLTADIQLAKLTAERFMDLYPLLPYHIDLIIQVVSGLRTQGGASKHVGGANRTIIKLAQQLLIHEAVGLAEKPIGALARIDQIYDLVAGNVSSEVRGKIAAIAKDVPHPMAQPVAKAICLLQYVQSIHRTAENIAATLHPGVEADAVLSEVKEALQALVDAHKVRLHDGQYRIPTPAEDDWETRRAALKPKSGDITRIHTDIIKGLWEPKPSHNLEDAKVFKGGLTFEDRPLVDGDIAFHLSFAEPGAELDERASAYRTRSQSEPKQVFWVAAVDDTIERHTAEVFRSKEILSRKERSAKTKVETGLVAEEKRRLRDHEGELKRRLREAMLAGSVFFRGNDRSPEEGANGVSQAASRVLGQVLPAVFDRFSEGGAKVTKKDLDALLEDENLKGLPDVFSQLGLLREENGKLIFVTDSGPLQEVFNKIDLRTSYGETANGKFLADEFSKEPFGWSLEVVRLFVVSLLRAGRTKATSKGTVIESATSLAARTTFPNNNHFRQASFQKVGVGPDPEALLLANEGHELAFGAPIPDISSPHAVASTLRASVEAAEPRVREPLQTLVGAGLPGQDVLQSALDQFRAIRTGSMADAIETFNASYKALGEAIERASHIRQKLTDIALVDLKRARHALRDQWPFLEADGELVDGLAERAAELTDLLERETFYRKLASIDQHAAAITKEYDARWKTAADARAAAYDAALSLLTGAPGWEGLDPDQRALVSSPLVQRTVAPAPGARIPFLRSECSACPQHLKDALRALAEIIEGNRLVTVSFDEYFTTYVETSEQLEAAVERFRGDVLKLLAQDKKVLVQ